MRGKRLKERRVRIKQKPWTRRCLGLRHGHWARGHGWVLSLLRIFRWGLCTTWFIQLSPSSFLCQTNKSSTKALWTCRRQIGRTGVSTFALSGTPRLPRICECLWSDWRARQASRPLEAGSRSLPWRCGTFSWRFLKSWKKEESGLRSGILVS